jgi:chloride channel protein, CIC family
MVLMVAEMTGSLSILAPAMAAAELAWPIVRRHDDTIYRRQGELDCPPTNGLAAQLSV